MLSEMTVPELKAKAKALGIPKADAMKKSDLIAAIEGHPPKSSSMKTDFAKHPKFDKFKPVGEN